MWKRQGVVALALALLIPFFGCVNAARIQHGKDKVGGIPFFTKRAIYRQTSIYDVRWLNVILEITPIKADPTAKEPPKSVVLTALALSDSAELEKLRTTLREATLGSSSPTQPRPGYNEVILAWETLRQAQPTVNPNRDPTATDLVSNSLSPDAIVDYESTYYLNGALPWFGSTKVNAELNTDGTLSKGSVETESKLAEAISTLIPLKEFLTGQFVKTPPAGSAATPEPFVYTLTIEPKGYRYTVTANYAVNPCKEAETTKKQCTLPPLTKNADSLWKRDPLAESKVEKKDDGKAIAFSGSVTLPKEEKKP